MQGRVLWSAGRLSSVYRSRQVGSGQAWCTYKEKSNRAEACSDGLGVRTGLAESHVCGHARGHTRKRTE